MQFYMCSKMFLTIKFQAYRKPRRDALCSWGIRQLASFPACSWSVFPVGPIHLAQYESCSLSFSTQGSDGSRVCSVMIIFISRCRPSPDPPVSPPPCIHQLTGFSHFVLRISGITQCAARVPSTQRPCLRCRWLLSVAVTPSLPCCLVFHVDVQLQICLLLAVSHVGLPIFSGACRAFLVAQHCGVYKRVLDMHLWVQS